MSFKVFFSLSTGFKCDLYFRKGTYDRILKHVNDTERRLGIRREYYNGDCRWNHWPLVAKEIDDKEYCDAVECHNAMVQYFYSECCEATNEPTEKRPDRITPDMAKNLFIGLSELDVPPERWTRGYYQNRMEAMYQTLRGNPTEGMSIDSEPLSLKQARDVIVLFAQYLDKNDIRLDVCKGQDELTDSYSEGYFWCAKCGAVDYDDLPYEFDTDSDLCYECQSEP